MSDANHEPRQLIHSTAETLRQRIFAHEPGVRIGSLREIAADFDVGIVTIQQVARILEYEGLLEVRRGPGGGYFGRRPDVGTLEGVLTAYMRSHPASWEDALELTSLLFIELCAAAAGAGKATDLYEELRNLEQRIADCDPLADLATLEEEFQDLLFRMVDRPLFELLTRVTLHFAASNPAQPLATGLISPKLWHEGRQRIARAILAQDVQLARFEANRSNREIILESIKQV